MCFGPRLCVSPDIFGPKVWNLKQTILINFFWGGIQKVRDTSPFFCWTPRAGETYEKMVLPVLSPDPNTDVTSLEICHLQAAQMFSRLNR